MSWTNWQGEAGRRAYRATVDGLDATSDIARAKAVRRVLEWTGDIPGGAGRFREWSGLEGEALAEERDRLREHASAALLELLEDGSESAREHAVRTVEQLEEMDPVVAALLDAL